MSNIQSTPPKLNSKISKAAILLSRIMLVPVLLFLIANGLTDYEEAEFLFATQSKWVLALLAICMVVFLYSFFRCMWNCLQKMTDRGHGRLRMILILGALCLQGIFLFYYRSSYLFDNAFVTGGASALAETGTVAEEAVYYLSVYPNQNAYVVLTAVLWKIGRWFGMSRGAIPLLLNFVNMLCLDSAVVLFFLIVKACKPELTSAKWTFLHLFMFMNPFLYIGVSYYYTITLSMPFIMLLFYFYVKYLSQERYKGVWVPVFMGVALGIGCLLRATTIIPAIAIACVILFYGKKRKKDLLILLVAVFCITGAGRMNSAYVGLDTENTAFPATHWIMMSMTSPGSHNAEDEAYTASYATAAEKKAAVTARIVEKAGNMDGGDWVSLAFAKIKNTWGNGSNGYTVYLEHCLRTDGLYKWVFGNHKDFLILYHQGYYLLMLLWILSDVVTSIKSKKTDSYVFQLTFLGGILFYLLWETSAQYSLPFLFVLMLLAACGMDGKVTEGQKINMDSTISIKGYVRFLPQVVCILFLVLFFIKKYPAFTQMEVDESNPVVTQILANEELELKEGENLEQSFRAAQPFNQIIFQWRNPDEESDAVYQVEVTSESGVLVCSDVIEAKGQPHNGASILSFDRVEPQKEEKYAIHIYKTAGSEKHNLRFVTYQMGLYDAYPFGAFTINGAEQPRDMLLAVSDVKAGPYCSPVFYWVTAVMIVILGAFSLLFQVRVIRRDKRVG